MTDRLLNLASIIDHTLLKPGASEQDILLLCTEAMEYGFKAVCVNPSRVPLASRTLEGSGIAVCSVVGFPLGATTTRTKAREAGEAVATGAREIDMVINIGFLKDGRREDVSRDIVSVIDAACSVDPRALIKVIIETGCLTYSEKLLACSLVREAGAHFVKTSTGLGYPGATLEDVRLLRGQLPPGIGVKASGGIRTLDQVNPLVEAGATRIGTSSGVAIINEALASKQ